MNSFFTKFKKIFWVYVWTLPLLYPPVYSHELKGVLVYSDMWNLKKYDFSSESVEILFTLSEETRIHRRSIIGGVSHLSRDHILVEGLVEDYGLYSYNINTGEFQHMIEGTSPITSASMKDRFYYWGVHKSKGKLFQAEIIEGDLQTVEILTSNSRPRGEIVESGPNQFFYLEEHDVKGIVTLDGFKPINKKLDCRLTLYLSKSNSILCGLSGQKYKEVSANNLSWNEKIFVQKNLYPVTAVPNSEVVLFNKQGYIFGNSLLAYNYIDGSVTTVAKGVNARFGAAVYISEVPDKKGH